MYQQKNYTLLLELLKSRGFIKPGTTTTSGVQYGALGALMRHHIQKQWWQTMVHGQDNVFPVEHAQICSTQADPSFSGLEQGDESTQIRVGLESACLKEYPHILKLTNGQLPFSVASIGACRGCQSNVTSEERDFFLGSSHRTQMLLQNYTPPTGSSRVLDYWLQLRLSWWKKFSRNPARFSVVSSSSAPNGEEKERSSPIVQNHLSIVYEFPWGPESVEEVSNLGDNLVRSYPEEERKLFKSGGSGRREVLPHCIQCVAGVEGAMAAWLVDAYHQRETASSTKKSTKVNQVLQLNSHIAPYQVAVVRIPAAASSPFSQEIDHVARKLVLDLQHAGISVFNAAHHGGSLLAHCKRNDQLGTPYTVILNAETLDNGLISIRCRDTELKESTHLAQTVEKLNKYLSAMLE